jgi:elongation factor Ts
MTIDANLVKELREKTGIGMMECKGALAEAGGNIEKAIDILRKKGVAKAAKKATRVAGQGQIGAYIHHGGKIGVLVEINCETDFVARTDAFQGLLKDMAMHVAAANPLYINREDISNEVIAKEREIYREQASGSGKPAQVLDKLVEGKLDKFYKEVCLMEQPFVKDDSKSIKDIVHEKISQLGENIVVKRFQRFQLGENA